MESLKKSSSNLRSPLIRDGILLALGGVINSFFGVVFWIIVARSFSLYSVGISASLFAFTRWGSLISRGGYEDALRYNIANQGQIELKEVLSIVKIILLRSIVFIMALSFYFGSYILNSTSNFAENFWIITLLVISINGESVYDAVSSGSRRASFIPKRVLVSGISKSVFALLFANFETKGILLSISLGSIIGIIFGIIILKIGVSTGRDIQKVKKQKVENNIDITKYSRNILISNIAINAPFGILPIVVLMTLEESDAAIFSICINIFLQLIYVTNSMGTSLMVEFSMDVKAGLASIKDNKMNLILSNLIPAIAVSISSKFILSFYGDEYITGSYLLFLFAITSIPYGFVSFQFNIWRGKSDLKHLNIYAIISNFMIILSTIALIDNFRYYSAAYSFLIISILALLVLLKLNNEVLALFEKS